ncbi:hypothetical protein OAG16_00620 [Saprospiraceae bacterium]|nr:hypothetical protein [Saprospiraceae bacterium]
MVTPKIENIYMFLFDLIYYTENLRFLSWWRQTILPIEEIMFNTFLLV